MSRKRQIEPDPIPDPAETPPDDPTVAILQGEAVKALEEALVRARRSGDAQLIARIAVQVLRHAKAPRPHWMWIDRLKAVQRHAPDEFALIKDGAALAAGGMDAYEVIDRLSREAEAEGR